MPGEASPSGVAVILVTAGQPPELLAATLAALARQSRAPLQILVGHAGHGQDAARIPDLPGLSQLDCAGAGLAACWNQALRQARAPLIAFLGIGALPDEDWIGRIELVFRRHPDLDALQGSLLAGPAAGTSAVAEPFGASDLPEAGGGPAGLDLRNFAIRRAVIHRYREPFSERIAGGEADDLRWKLAAAGIRLRHGGAIAVRDAAWAGGILRGWRAGYRAGIGLQQLRRLHDGFWDDRLNPAQSVTATLGWLRRELTGRRQGGPGGGLAARVAHALSRAGLLAGLWAGRNRSLPPRPGASPEDLLFVVTNKCNLRCRHCFFTEQLEKPTVSLGSEAVARLVDSLTGDLRTVSFTGGEPFLCPDLVRICEILATRVGVKELYIVSNGFYPARVAESVERILAFAPYRLIVRISLDGLEPTHNRMRDNPRSFARAVETLGRLKTLAARCPRLAVQVQTSVGTGNLAELDAMADFVARELGLFQAFEIIRDVAMTAGGDWLADWYGPPEKATLLTADEMSAARDKVAAIYARHLPMGHFTRYQSDFQLGLMDLAVRQIKAGRPAIGCTSGDSFACVFPNLDVAICEMTRPIGNLADFDHDLPSLLRERFTPDLRRLRDGCYCTNACNNSSTLKSLGGATRHPSVCKRSCGSAGQTRSFMGLRFSWSHLVGQRQGS